MSVFKTNAFAIRVSREEMIAYGHVKPTPEEVERHNADSRERWEKSVAEWAEADEFRSALANVTDTVARIVLDIHRPIDDDTPECYGCPTFDESHEQWPCATTKAVARAVGIEPPDAWLGQRPGPEPHQMPQEGYEPFVLPVMDGFVRAFDAATLTGEGVIHPISPKD